MTAEHEAKINHVLDMKSAQEKIMDRQEAKLSHSSWISMYWHSYWIFLMVRYDSIEDILYEVQYLLMKKMRRLLQA
jgi:hypothetical protein